MDLAIAERAAALFPPLGSARGWAARFGRELNATDDRAALQAARTVGLPVVEGKQLEPFRVELDAVRYSDSAARRRAGCCARIAHERPRLAYRDVASATNRLDAHRGDAARRLRLHAHRLLPAHAAARRARSTSCAGSSTASSSTTSSGFA